MITCGSLFTGIGGIDLAFSRAGFDIRWQVEIDPFCRKVLAKHHDQFWPNAKVYEDIRHVRRINLEPVDVLFGGFPCQDISAAGKMAGIKEGNRSGLWFEFQRLIGELRPRYVFIENVPAITGNGGPTVLAGLAALRYAAEWGIVPAAAAGAPHRRERWFCVAYRERIERRDTLQGTLGGKHAQVSEWQESNLSTGSSSSLVADAAGERLSVGDSNGQHEMGTKVFTGLQSELERYGALVDEYRTQGFEFESGMGRGLDGLSFGLHEHRWPAGYGSEQYDWEPPRTVKPRTVPDRVARLKALGNAVVPQVIEPFAKLIRERIEAENGQ